MELKGKVVQGSGIMRTSSLSFLITAKLALAFQPWLGNDLHPEAVGTKYLCAFQLMSLTDSKAGEATRMIFAGLGSSQSAH